ncbi:MAG TPA: hypothetical protein VLH41_06830 [Thermoanaerobaculia bacterium]|nr:hypothetical protein [Thermoanaerobaculia bacterium]
MKPALLLALGLAATASAEGPVREAVATFERDAGLERSMERAMLADPGLARRAAGPRKLDAIEIYHVLDDRDGSVRGWFQLRGGRVLVDAGDGRPAVVLPLPLPPFDGIRRLAVLDGPADGPPTGRIVTPLRRGEPVRDEAAERSLAHRLGPGRVTLGVESDLPGVRATIGRAPATPVVTIDVVVCETSLADPGSPCVYLKRDRVILGEGPESWWGGGAVLGFDLWFSTGLLRADPASATLALLVDLTRAVDSGGTPVILRAVHVEDVGRLALGTTRRLDLTPPHWTRAGRVLLEMTVSMPTSGPRSRAGGR